MLREPPGPGLFDVSARQRGGTRLRLVHAGFRLPLNQVAYDAMMPGWGQILRERLRSVLAQPSS